jgi:DNA-binding NarL/FixJ family response regulator
MQNIRIFLADDHSIVRDGLRLILDDIPEYELVGESGDGKETLELVEKLKPDITVLDISMPTMNGIDVARRLRKYVPETSIIILSRHDNELYVKQLLEYGVKGYVLKDDAGDDLIRAVDEVSKGNIYLSPKLTTYFVQDYIHSEKTISDAVRESPLSKLSAREREVLKLIAEGNSSKEIASILRISPKTVKVHRANIMNNLDIHNIAELVTYAIKNGLVEI